jgi:hypothetical protein
MTTISSSTINNVTMTINNTTADSNNPYEIKCEDPHCNHNHAETPDTSAAINVDELKLDLKATMGTGGTPRWAKTPVALMKVLHDLQNETAKDTPIVILISAGAWSWLLTNGQFLRMFVPSKQAQEGLLGRLGPRMIFITDAFLPPNEQVSESNSYRLCSLKVKE